jgi:hypothetical protein
MPKLRKVITSQARFAKIVEALRHHAGVTPPLDATGSSNRFGSSGLKVDGKIFAMISSKGQFVVKLPRQRIDALVTAGQGERFDPGHGRLMKQWLAVPATSRAAWLALAREALEFVASK